MHSHGKCKFKLQFFVNDLCQMIIICDNYLKSQIYSAHFLLSKKVGSNIILVTLIAICAVFSALDKITDFLSVL